MITETIARKVLEVVDAGLVRGLGEPVPGQMCVEAAVCYAMGLPHSDKPDCVSPALRELKIRLNDARWSSDAARTAGLRRLAVAQLGSAGALSDKEFIHSIVKLAIRKAVPRALRSAASVQRDAVKASKLVAAAAICEREGTRDSVMKARDIAEDVSYAAAVQVTHATAAAHGAIGDSNAAVAADAAVAAYNVTEYAASAVYATYAAATAAFATYAYAVYAAVHTSAAAAAAAAAAGAATTLCSVITVNAAALRDAGAVSDKFLAEFCEAVVQILVQMKAPGCQWLALTEAA